jgi:hypothetical protein
MLYKILADLVVFVHFLWILFLFLGALWGRQKKFIKILHLSGLGFALLLQVSGWYCPLTYLEIWLRAKYHPELAYTGSYIIHYMEQLIYIEISPSVILIVTLLLIAFNLWIYLQKSVRISKKEGPLEEKQ